MSNVLRIPKRRTEAQRAAARANGAKSRGPVTDEGKAKAAMNALRHGLTAGALVLSTEDKAKFDDLLNAYIDEYQPATQTESDLVQELAASKWLQRRCWALQTALLDVTMERMADEGAEEFTGIPNSMRTALAFAKAGDMDNALVLLNRYAGRHSREWHKAVDKLRTIQKERAHNESEPSLVPNVQNSTVREGGAHRSALDRPDLTISPNEPEQQLKPVSTTSSQTEHSPATRPQAPCRPLPGTKEGA